MAASTSESWGTSITGWVEILSLMAYLLTPYDDVKMPAMIIFAITAFLNRHFQRDHLVSDRQAGVI